MDCCLEIPGYFTSQRQEEHLRRLRREFPFVYIHELTRTAYDRPIHALQIGSGDRKILLTAGHHANETITSEVLWRFLFTYCKALRAERTVCGADALSLYHEAMVSSRWLTRTAQIWLRARLRRGARNIARPRRSRRGFRTCRSRPGGRRTSRASI